MYVIIGATSHTGNAAANKLLAHGKKVRVVARNADHLTPLVSKGRSRSLAMLPRGTR